MDQKAKDKLKAMESGKKFEEFSKKYPTFLALPPPPPPKPVKGKKNKF
jgi:hypothetical protein